MTEDLAAIARVQKMLENLQGAVGTQIRQDRAALERVLMLAARALEDQA